LDKAAILRRYRRALKAARLDESHRFHDLRHTFGTRMAAAGGSTRTLQEWVGHRDIGPTQRYADYPPSPHEAAGVEAAFGGAAEECGPGALISLDGQAPAEKGPWARKVVMKRLVAFREPREFEASQKASRQVYSDAARARATARRGTLPGVYGGDGDDRAA